MAARSGRRRGSRQSDATRTRKTAKPSSSRRSTAVYRFKDLYEKGGELALALLLAIARIARPSREQARDVVLRHFSLHRLRQSRTFHTLANGPKSGVQLILVHGGSP